MTSRFREKLIRYARRKRLARGIPEKIEAMTENGTWVKLWHLGNGLFRIDNSFMNIRIDLVNREWREWSSLSENICG